jgi:hypothetical protein
MTITRHRMLIAAAAAAVVAAAGTGAAFATGAVSTGTSPQERQAEILDDLAGRLGVSVDKLKTAIRGVASDQIDQALADGKLTQEQADALRQRLQSSQLLPFRLGGGPGHGPRAGAGVGRGLDAAASYLGLTKAELRTKLASGQSLAAIAKAQGKTTDGLVSAMLADASKRLDDAVAAGRLTSDQKEAILARLKTGLTAMVEGKRPPPPGPRFRFGRG